MKRNTTLFVIDIVGSPVCVASGDGQRINDRIAAALKEGRGATISFLRVSCLTAAFLNAAIGQLYGSFTDNEIRSKLKVKDIEPADLALLKRVVETAKQYFRHPKRFNKAVQEVLRDRG
jgi:hypothetical protein